MARILHVITGLDQGGAESILVKLLENYNNEEDKFYVVSLKGSGFYSARVGAVCERLHHLEIRGLKSFFQAIFRFISILRAVKPDVVQTWMYHSDLIGGLLSKLFSKSKIYWNIRNGNVDPKLISRSTWIVVKISAWLSRYIPNKIVSCSNVAGHTHIEIGYAKEKIVIINNGVLTDQLYIDKKERERLRGELKITEDTLVVGNISRWHPLKDHFTLLKSFSLVLKLIPAEKLCLVLIGKGLETSNNELEKMIKELDISERIKLLGPTSNIKAALNLLDLHVLSSRGEAFPNVVAEAMACGVQGVVTDVGDAAFILGDDRFVAPAGNAEELADCISKSLLYIKNTGENYREKNRKRVMDNFSIEKMCSEYSSLWHS